IGDYNDKPIKASPNPEVTHGSYQFLLISKKRSKADYKGLDIPSYKKKKRNKAKSNKATTKDIAISLTNIYTYRREKAPHSIVEDILINYIKLNDLFRRYRYRLKLKRSRENIFSEIIKKGAELLNLKDLLISKGPLNKFMIAEKVATERFIREAGYRLSLTN
ncbi:hypothetical protein N7530_010685, partial [Penicillium desertorum]